MDEKDGREWSRWQAQTQAAQALGRTDGETGGIVPPVHIASTYLRDADNQYRTGYVYGRPHNATARLAEEVIAAQESGAAAYVFASGMAAATALFLALGPGAHVIAPQQMYWALRGWLANEAGDHGLEVEFADFGDAEKVRALVRPRRTKLIWAETPANPLWGITDIAALSQIARAAGALLAVDSTVATPVLTRPIEHGADFVMHSATKYLNGHSDVLAGALVCAEKSALWDRAGVMRDTLGAVLGPFEASLLVRGMRTLHLRVERACRTAMHLASHFNADPRIEAVLYPGLPDHPGHAVAARQMAGGFGGMLSIRVKGGGEAAIGAAAKVRLWKRATSLGGVESLIEHRSSIEGPSSPVPGDLLRLSVGIEHAGDLIADLDQALG